MGKLLPLTLAIACNAELILDGGDNGWSQWYRSVDGVMGGRSSISVQRDGNVLEASGEIVTAGGGFAGMYTRLDDVDASNFAGLRVTYEALPAGQTPLAWEVRLKGRGDSSRYIDFGASFAVPPSSVANDVGSVSLPFEEFLPRWRGNDRTGTLDLTALNEVGLQLLFQDGPFTLRLREISLVESIAPPADPAPGMDATPSAVRDAIDAATRRADYLVGKGYAAQAAAVLASTARAVATTLDGVPGTARAQEALVAALAEASAIVATNEEGRVGALRVGLDAAKIEAAGPAWTKSYAEVGRVCRPKNDDGYVTTKVEDAAACRALCDADTTCGAWEYENYAADDRECELHEASVVDAKATAAQGPCQTSDPENYRCCHIDEALIETPADDPDTESEEDATQYVPPAKPAPADDATAGDHGGSKKKQSKGSEWPVVVGVVLALTFLMILGIGCSLWARGARVDPSDSKAAAAAPNEETEEPLQVV